MNTRKLTTYLTAPAVVCILTICAEGPVSAAHAAQADRAREAIVAQSKAFMDRMEHGDVRAAAEVFTADAKLIVSGVDRVIAGRDAIEKFWQSAVSGGVKALRLTMTDLEGDGPMRVETGTYLALGAGDNELARGHYMFVWKKEGGTWKIHRDIGSERPAQKVASAATDRVGFPRDYRTALKLLSVRVKDEEPSITSAYGNELATSITTASQLPYPYGTVIAVEFAHGARDGEGQLLHDPSGSAIKAEVARIDVMRRERGYGEVYGENRAGEWEFASYRPDGSTLISPENSVACAACHLKAGAARDFVYRIRVPAQ
jgi:ketosteroid isomerase-like protein